MPSRHTTPQEEELRFKVQDVILKDGHLSATATIQIMQLIEAEAYRREQALLDELIGDDEELHVRLPGEFSYKAEQRLIGRNQMRELMRVKYQSLKEGGNPKEVICP